MSVNPTVNVVKPINGSPAKSPLPSPVRMTSAPATPDKEAMLKPKKTGSIALFFRKVSLEFVVGCRIGEIVMKVKQYEILLRCLSHKIAPNIL